jgi:hypothetical protein
MEKIKKERRFLKTLGKVGEILIQEVLIKVGSSLIKRIGGKKNMPSILFLFLSINLFAQYPNTGNKQRLGYQTTADGLVWRGSISDTASIQPVSNQNAWVILDTGNLKIYSFDFTSNVWNQVGGGAFAQPIDSLFFKTSVSPNNVDTAKMRWDYELGTVVLGMYDQVPNELGFKNFWLVKNQTGSTITKNSLVYASGTVGTSGRISVLKFIANGTIDAKYLLGITAHDLSDGEDGYVISFGKIRQVNTDTFAAGAILYPSPTTAGVWTDVEPVAPNIDMPIGFCINSSSNNGTIAIRYASGYKLNELHDLAVSSPVDKASLYYSGGLWRDTTAAVLTSDTSSMLTNYLRSGIAALTYLPLTGGTLTGALNGTTGTFAGLNVINSSTEGVLTLQGADNNTAERIRFNTTGSIRKEIVLPSATSNLEFRTSTVGGTEGGYSFYTRRNPNAEQLAFNIDYNRDIQMYGALSVTGATTLTGALTVNNATVLNEGSGDFDTRIESDGNANMVFVDASTDRVGIGTNAPSKTLDIVGTLGVSSTATFAGNTVIDGGLKGKIKKESGTGGFFNQIPSDVITYIFEYTGVTTGGGSTDFLGSPASHTNRIINIINVSDVDYFLGFTTNLPYIKTNTTITQLDYGKSMTVQSDGSKWWVISRNF